MDLKGSGELVIGTTGLTGTASQRLQVTGGAYVSGSVGIGTTNPVAPLDIRSSSIHTDGTAFFRITASNSINYIQSGVGMIANSAASLVFGTIFAGAEWARFTPTGNLGIGTANPIRKLHVVGNSIFNGNLEIGNVIDIVPYDTLNNGTLSFEASAGQLFSITNNLTTGSIFSVNDVSGIPSIDVDANGTVELAPFGGNVGIGLTNPSQKLTVSGNILLGTSTSGGTTTPSYINLGTNFSSGQTRDRLKIYLYDDGSSGKYGFTVGPSGDIQHHSQGVHDFYVNNSFVMRVGLNNNIGIGTTNPGNRLHVSGSARIGSLSAARSNNGLTVGFTSNTAFAFTTDTDDANRTLSLVNESTTTNAMSVLGFRVNPGTPNANAMLDMKFVQTGGTNTSTLYYSFNHGGNWAERFLINSAGQVGINVTNPGGTLDVSGGLNEVINVTQTTPSSARWILKARTTGILNDTGIYQDASNNMQFAARDGSGALRLVLDTNNTAGSYLNTTAGFAIGSNSTTPGYTTLATNLRLGVSSKSGTYSMSGTTTVTITCTNHGLTTGDSVFIDFTSGTAVDNYFNQVTVTNANTFTVIAGGALTTSGNCTIFPETQLRFPGVFGDGNNSFDHTVISERNWGASDRAELLIFKGNDGGTSIQDNIRLAASGDIYFHAGAGTLTYNGYINSFGNTINSSTLSILASGNIGIGITNPASRLVINGFGSNTTLRFKDGSFEADVGYVDNTGNLTIQNWGNIVFRNGSPTPVETVRISSGGNVGIATTNPVNGLDVRNSFGRGAPVTQTGNFTVANTNNWIICNGTGTITVTLPAASSWTGRELMFKTIAAQSVISASSNVVPLAGGAAGTAILSNVAGRWAKLVSDGTNWIIMQAN
jgi:hypothetical protein